MSLEAIARLDMENALTRVRDCVKKYEKAKRDLGLAIQNSQHKKIERSKELARKAKSEMDHAHAVAQEAIRWVVYSREFDKANSR